MNVHIGQIIRKELKTKGITLRKFSDHMGMSDRNIQHFLSRDDIPTSQLQRASEFLKEDLTIYFRPKNLENILAEPATTYRNEQNQINISLGVIGVMASMKNFPQMIEEFDTIATKHGFILK